VREEVQRWRTGAVEAAAVCETHNKVEPSRDVDGHRARTTRERMLARLAASESLLLGTHFAEPSAGRLVAYDGGYRFVPGRTLEPISIETG